MLEIGDLHPIPVLLHPIKSVGDVDVDDSSDGTELVDLEGDLWVGVEERRQHSTSISPVVFGDVEGLAWDCVVVDLNTEFEGEGEERECFSHFALLELVGFGFGLGVKVAWFILFDEGEEVVV
jgi:hypothetical protein